MTALPPLPCYLNGEFTRLPDAKISVMDRGFIFGDGVYEVVPVYSGVPFRFEHHMARLERSLGELRIKPPLSRIEWLAILRQLIATYADSVAPGAKAGQEGADTGAGASGPKKSAPDQLIYIQVTRGVAMRDHVMPPDLTPTVFAMTNALKQPTADMRENGVACVSADDFRWEKGHIKSTSLLGAVFARQISFDADATETLMFRDGYLTEAAASNVWIVKNGKLIGSPKDNLVLEGIRYGLFDEICREIGIELELRRIARAEVLSADELLLTSATKEVLAITRLDGNAVGSVAFAGRPGPIYKKLYAAYQAVKMREIAANAPK
jgi:D-alanine transaminase